MHFFNDFVFMVGKVSYLYYLSDSHKICANVIKKSKVRLAFCKDWKYSRNWTNQDLGSFVE